MTQQTQTTQKAVEMSPKCPGCGANLVFAPDKQALACEHCGNSVAVIATPAMRFPLSELQQSKDQKWENTAVFECGNCGANEVVSSHAMSKFCAFCGSASVVEKAELSGLKPNAVIPFKISKVQAKDKLVAWAKKKIFAPSRFKKGASNKDIDGVYKPAFTFDAQTSTQFNGVLSRVETHTVTINGRTTVQSRTITFPISGTFQQGFDSLMIQACDSIKQRNLDKIQPFPDNSAKDFNNAYLFGFVASQHKRDGVACWDEARKTMEQRIRQAILAQHPGTSVVSFNMRTSYITASYRYILIPIFVGHFNYKNKLYQFFVNGDTGAITGKTPLSPLRILLAVSIGLGLVGGIVALIVLFMNGVV
ncbi:MAG: hypothetical protein FWE13_06310 [Firmicutes bacterium]|nr:hypothetical protein [Bacillota bacterium]